MNNKTLDFSYIGNVASAEQIDEMSGNQFVITFTNGKRLMIAPLNGGIFWYDSPEAETARHQLLVDMDDGHSIGRLPSFCVFNEDNDIIQECK